HFILSHSGGCARFAGLPPASVLSPTSWAQNSSGFQPDKFQFVGQIGAIFQNGADSSIAYKLYGTRVPMQRMKIHQA
ncbi:MAG: hypothetical protein IJN23_06890, partial [Akkermansia sp.]|nr:hypothetical protein [Akkermansia sp.]